MKFNYPKYFIIIIFALLIAWTLSCSGRSGKKISSDLPPVEILSERKSEKFIKIISPDEDAGFKLRDQVKVILALVDKTRLPDSVLINFDGQVVKNLKSEPWEFSIPSILTGTTGRKSLKIAAYKDGRARNTITRFMIIYSDVVPKRYGYKVIHSYPHDKDAFTQGLVYDKGVLYEGTGQESGSTLREVELESGKVKRQLSIDPTLFGEGIALFHDRIYQVTWKSKIGFVYDKSTFKERNRIYYSTQGWGMTTIDDKIVMSDGTNVLSFYEPEMFTVTSRIEVYDNEHKVDSLNELEYINGEIWANIWMNNHIARIDPVSGKVLAYIDLTGILPESEKTNETDVLNGIAWDEAGKRIFVTGKKWPKLYEIKLTE